MKYTSFVLLTAGSRLASALTQTCTGKAVDEGGNWFCGAVNEIVYEGFLQSGSYKAVTSMTDSGECLTEEKAYGGPLSPLDEGLSIHVRGPINFKQFAVFHLASDRKRDLDPSPHVYARRHGHEHFHEQRKKKRADWIVATIDNQVVSWPKDFKNFLGPQTSTADATATEPVATQPAATEPVSSKVAEVSGAPDDQPYPSSSSSSSPPKSSGSSNTGAWERTSYYNAEQQTAENVVFLGNYGGQGSGVWDTKWGNSLSYITPNASGGSDTYNILKDVFVPSLKEFAIFSAEKCDSTCGYSRVPELAYKGFSGANKIFLFEFKMPYDGNRGFLGDMPALWALNARIPRTAQYSACNCWTSGCGEADIYEVLASGDNKCKSTFHLQNGAGSSDYFERPTNEYVKVAVIFWEKTATVSIKQLPKDVSFESLSSATVSEWLDTLSASKTGITTSLFQVAP
ncbi:putative TOS1-like glycosyl hydrolase-domain-containing protein [Mariannaea sp. PMI_226]|nr:putative TOS1-like glycosyl hydrolase-domain-containing protein [Mariannaea sp. PMI_226]